MIDDNDVKKLIGEFKKVFPTKEDVKDIVKEEIDALAIMVNNAFNENEKRMNEGFSAMRQEFKTVNEKLDKKVEGIDKRLTVVEEALAIK